MARKNCRFSTVAELLAWYANQRDAYLGALLDANRAAFERNAARRRAEEEKGGEE